MHRALILLALLGCEDETPIFIEADAPVRVRDAGGEADGAGVDAAADGLLPADGSLPVDEGVPDAAAELDLGPELDAVELEPDALEPEPDAAPGPMVDPFAPGPFTVREAEGMVEVAETGGGAFGRDPRVLPIRVYLPEGREPISLLVFSPGFQLGDTHYPALGNLAASHGIAVLIPTYGDSIVAAIDHSDLATFVSRLIDWAVEQNGLRGRVESIFTGGHSRGGKIAFLAAIRDERVEGTFTFDPVDITGNPFAPPPPTPENPSVTPELMGDYAVPAGIFGAGRGAEGAVACAPEGENYAAYFEALETEGTLWVAAGAGHLDFAEALPFIVAAGCPAGDTPEVVRGYANGLLVAYLATLAGQVGYAGALEAALPEGVERQAR